VLNPAIARRRLELVVSVHAGAIKDTIASSIVEERRIERKVSSLAAAPYPYWRSAFFAKLITTGGGGVSQVPLAAVRLPFRTVGSGLLRPLRRISLDAGFDNPSRHARLLA